MEHYQPKPILLATWNTTRDCWEGEQSDIFGHLDVYSETWPTSGMTVNGTAYAHPTSAPPTSGSASSSSPPDAPQLLGTPRTAQGTKNDLRDPAVIGNARGRIEDQIALLKTPTLADEMEHLLPTPVAQPSGNTPEDHLRKKPGRERVTDLAIMAENDLMATGGKLLPTPTAMNPNEEEDMDAWEARRAKVKAEKRNGNGFGMPLGIAACQIGAASNGDRTPRLSVDGNKY